MRHGEIPAFGVPDRHVPLGRAARSGAGYRTGWYRSWIAGRGLPWRCSHGEIAYLMAAALSAGRCPPRGRRPAGRTAGRSTLRLRVPHNLGHHTPGGSPPVWAARPRRRRSQAAGSSITIGIARWPSVTVTGPQVCRGPLAGIVRISVSALTPQPLNMLTDKPVRRSGRMPPQAGWSTARDGASGGN